MKQVTITIHASVVSDTSTKKLADRLWEQMQRITNPVREDQGICEIEEVAVSYGTPPAKVGAKLTAEEKDVMQKLVDFWHAYLALPETSENPQTADICRHVREMQHVLAVRVAKRADPDIWA